VRRPALSSDPGRDAASSHTANSHTSGSHTPSSDMVSVDSHLAEILATIRPLPPVMLSLAEAEGGVLAEDVTAGTPLPSFDNSAMDGYAVRARDIEGASEAAPVTLPVTAEIAAGDTGSYQVTPGTCVRIMTGALLPPGADAVVQVEWTDGGTTRAQFRRPVAPGDAIRRRGDDVAKGAVLVTAGTWVGPVQLALLAAAGVGTALVRPRPRVAVISTGNELAEPGTPIIPGRIWDSNSFMLAAAARQAGAVADRHRISDDPAGVLAAIDDQLARADLLVTSGGVSMGGEHDVVKAALAGLGTVTFRKVAMQPGMPQGFGVVGPQRTPIFTLPGNPVSAFVSFEIFVRPALRALQGLNTERTSPARAILTGAVRSPLGRRSFLRGILDAEEGKVTPLTGQASHQLGALAQANALIIVPEQVVAMDAGDPAEVVRLP
jgi:molybdopterin molybdotransferase